MFYRNLCSLLLLVAMLATPVAALTIFEDSTPFYDDGGQTRWLNGWQVFPQATAMGPEGDGVVGQMVVSSGASFVDSMSAVVAPTYPITLQYVVQKIALSGGNLCTSRLYLRSDTGHNIGVDFNHHAPHMLGVISYQDAQPMDGNELFDTGMTFNAGDWARLTITIPAENAVTVSLEKWQGSAWSAPSTHSPTTFDTTLAGGVVPRDSGRRVYAQTHTNGGWEATVLYDWLKLSQGLPGQTDQITLLEDACYHDSTYGGDFGSKEGGTVDDGGVLYLFVRNDSTTAPMSITDVKVGGVSFGGGANHAWRAWPTQVPPAGQGNNVVAVTIKGWDQPFREGNTLNSGSDITVHADGGASGSLNTSVPGYQFYTPTIRLGNVVPTRDMQHLYIYVRHEADRYRSDSNTYDLLELRVNEHTYTSSSPDLESLGNRWSLGPNQVAIFKLDYPTSACDPLAIRLKTQQQGGGTYWTSSAVRVVPPEFPLGTWSGSLFNPENMDRRKIVREQWQSSIVGPGLENAAEVYEHFSIRNVREPGFGDSETDPNWTAPAIAEVLAHKNGDYVHLWSVDDEPDLHGKDIYKELIKNQVYWDYDDNTPSYVNLCAQKKYNRYGWLSDVISMDHYSQIGAPNIIPWPHTTQPFETFEYTAELKYNTEPRRMYTWAAVADKGWGKQPRQFMIDFQFWSHLMYGAKGIHWYNAKPEFKGDGDGDPTSFNDCWWKAHQITRKFTPVMNLFLYGEMSNCVWRSTTDVKSRALIGPDAMVVVVVNGTVKTTGFITHDNEIGDDVAYQVAFDVPEWIPVEQAYRVDNDGVKTPVVLEHLGGRQYRIDSTASKIYAEQHVYVIGKNDTIPPEKPTRLFSPTADTLSWQPPQDNFGVKGFNVYRDGGLVATTFEPIYIPNPGTDLDCGSWRVEAFDASGNVGPLSDAFNPCAATMKIWDFNDGSTQGWGGANNLTGFAGNGTELVATYTNHADPHFSSAFGLTIDDPWEDWCLSMEVDFQPTGNAADVFQVFVDTGSGFNEGDSTTFTVQPGVGTYRVDLRTIGSGWTNISQIRIDPGANGTNLGTGTVSFNYIAVTAGVDWQYNRAGDTEGWAIQNQISGMQIASYGGESTLAINSQSEDPGAADPSFGSSRLYFDGNRERYLVIRQQAVGHSGPTGSENDPTTGEIFAFDNIPEGPSGLWFAHKGFTYYPNLADFSTLVLDMHTATEAYRWTDYIGRIENLRIDPFMDVAANWQPAGAHYYDHVTLTSDPTVFTPEGHGPYQFDFDGADQGSWVLQKSTGWGGGTLVTGSGTATVTRTGAGKLGLTNYDVILDANNCAWLEITTNPQTSDASDFTLGVQWASNGDPLGFSNRVRQYTLPSNSGSKTYRYYLHYLGGQPAGHDGGWLGYVDSLLLNLDDGSAAVTQVVTNQLRLLPNSSVAAPTLVDSDLPDSTHVVVSFSQQMGDSALNPANYTVSGSGQGSLASQPDSVVLLNGHTCLLTWNSGSMASGDLTVALNNLADAAGTAMAAGTQFTQSTPVVPPPYQYNIYNGGPATPTWDEGSGVFNCSSMDACIVHANANPPTSGEHLFYLNTNMTHVPVTAITTAVDIRPWDGSVTITGTGGVSAGTLIVGTGGNVVVRGNFGGGGPHITFDGGNNLVFANGGTLTVNTCALRNSNNNAARVNAGGTLNLTNCTLELALGNGIANQGGVLTCDGCSIDGNAGHGVYQVAAAGTTTLTNTTVTNNGADGVRCNVAGSLFNANAGSVIADNVGNGITVELSAQLTVEDSSIQDNGMYGVQWLGTGTSDTSNVFRRCQLRTGNSSALFKKDDGCYVANCLLEDPVFTGKCGDIAFDLGSGGTAGYPGGFAVQGTNADGTVRVDFDPMVAAGTQQYLRILNGCARFLQCTGSQFSSAGLPTIDTAGVLTGDVVVNIIRSLWKNGAGTVAANATGGDFKVIVLANNSAWLVDANPAANLTSFLNMANGSNTGAAELFLKHCTFKSDGAFANKVLSRLIDGNPSRNDLLYLGWCVLDAAGVDLDGQPAGSSCSNLTPRIYNEWGATEPAYADTPCNCYYGSTESGIVANASSPAIHTRNPSLAADGSLTTTSWDAMAKALHSPNALDIDKSVRPNPSGSTPDIGAYENDYADVVSPSGTISINSGAAWANNTAVSLTLSASDSASGVWQMNVWDSADLGWEDYATSRGADLSVGDGSKTVKVRYKDNMGNLSDWFEDHIQLDQTDPTGTVSIDGGAAYTTTSDVNLTLTADDLGGSGVTEMKIGNSDGAGSWEPFIASRGWGLGTTEGTRTVFVYFRDQAGNESGPFVDDIVFDSSLLPIPSIPSLVSADDTGVSDGDNVTNKTTLTLKGSAENGATVEIYKTPTLLGSAVVVGGSYQVTVTLTEGTHELYAVADLGAQGRSENSGNATIVVDRTAPEVTVEQAFFQSDPTWSQPLAYTVTASQPVYGLTTGDFVVGGIGTQSATVTLAGVDGDDQFAVQVGGLVAPVTVTLDLPADVCTDLAGNQNLASTSLDNAVTLLAENQPATQITLSNNWVDHLAPLGRVVGTLSNNDPDTGQSFTYALVSGDGSEDNSTFEIVGNELRVLVAPDYHVKNILNIRVQVSDDGTPVQSYEQQMIVYVRQPPSTSSDVENWQQYR